ncbi:hypothetical protein F1654_03115 [Alkalicaulis satelles]|uniref:Uncharacterized protein n=1 Tax=Alkalicaulis satelles TaxID=2609175 RepID=A0A5M6ZL11_9PROT|nr:hypothetical protein [Alkalicaulis satelles]KAA5805000.1 hypothetical protein F1654_03115 [Alkalicaulis satelles]
MTVLVIASALTLAFAEQDDARDLELQPGVTSWYEPCGPVCGPERNPVLTPSEGRRVPVPGTLVSLINDCHTLITRMADDEIADIGDYDIHVMEWGADQPATLGSSGRQPDGAAYKIVFMQRMIARQYLDTGNPDGPFYVGFGGSGAGVMLICRAEWGDNSWVISDARTQRSSFWPSPNLVIEAPQE